MQATLREVSDVSIVAALPASAFTLPSDMRALFDSDALRDLIGGSQGYNQVMQIAADTGATSIAHRVESMRTQKIVSVSDLRIEVHDRSGDLNLERLRRVPEITSALFTALGIGQLKAIGANIEATYRLAEAEGSAAGAIARQVLPPHVSVVPESVHLAGAGTRLFLSDDMGRTYLVAIEPRFNDRASQDLYLLCNIDLATEQVPSLDALNDLFDTGYRAFQGVVDRLLSTRA